MRPPSLAVQRTLLLASFVFVLSAMAPVARVQDDAVARVEAGLREGDPDAVLADAADRVEVILFGEGGMYRRAQASHVLRDFFRRYPPARVAFGPERSSSYEGLAATGQYVSDDGSAPLNVRVVHREDGEDWELVSIRIDQRSAVRADGR